jgi:peptidoglycan/LPS O-acetylase OafA/YrhL
MGSRGIQGPTIATTFDRRRNSLNAVRLLLALLVIVSHSWALGGFGDEPHLGGAHLGTWAVLGFFAISGYLITASRLNSSPRRFYRARALRIFPGFIVCIVVVAVVFAPLSTLISGEWSLVSAAGYVLRNLLLYPPHLGQDQIAGTLGAAPFVRTWDGSLWTLFWEAACYMLIAVMISAIPRRLLIAAVLGGYVVFAAVSVATATGAINLPGIANQVSPLFGAFLAGALIFLSAERVPVTAVTIVIALVWIAIAVALGLVQAIGGLPIAFLLFVAGSRPEAAMIGRERDLSYGFYIYAWPVQQLTILVLHGAGGVALLIVLSIVVTLPLAFLSCVLVEKPALRLVDRARTKLPAVAPVR